MERVVGVAAVDAVVARPAVDHVVAEPAVGEVVAGPERDSVLAGAAEGDVVAVAAVDLVVAGRARQRSLPGPPSSCVVAAPAAQQVVAAEPDDAVGAARAVERRPAPSVPTSSARPGCTTSGPAPAQPARCAVAAPENADRTETVPRPGSETYSRTPSGDQAARPGPPPLASARSRVGGRGRRARPCGGCRAGARRARRPRACRRARRRRRRHRRCRAGSPPSPGRGPGRCARAARPRLRWRGSVAATHAWPAASMPTPAAPTICSRRTSRPVVALSTATRPPASTATTRASGVRQVDRRAPQPQGRDPLRRGAASSTSIAPRRAAYTRVPSGDTASASGTPLICTPPAASRDPRSIHVTKRPAATYARVPSGDTATARVRPGNVTPPIGRVRPHVEQRGAASRRSRRPSRAPRLQARPAPAGAGRRGMGARDGLTRPITCSRAVGRRSFPGRDARRRRRRS